MVIRCAWGTCKSDSRYPERLKKEDGTLATFHSFPGAKKYNERREAWIRACCRGDEFICKKDSYICSLHFIGECGPTVENPDPIPATASTEKAAQLKRKRRPPIIRNAKRRKTSQDKSAAETLLMLSQSTDAPVKQPTEKCVDNVLPTTSPSKTSSSIFIETVNVKSTQTNIELEHISTIPDNQLKDNGHMTRALFIKSVEDPKKSVHYTGLDIDVLHAVYNLVKEKASRLYMWKGSKNTKDKYVKNQYLEQKYGLRKLTVWEQMILSLVRLKRKTSIVMLADLFAIAPGTVNRIFITWVLFLEKELSFLLSFSTLDEMSGVSLPKAFKSTPNLRGIIDCTEFYIETPARISSQRSTYSSYKSRNTFKLFLSISPIPHFNFVSSLYSGSISDKEITKQCGFLEKLNPGDVIMADKGFNIQDLLALHHTRLLAPPIMKKGKVSSKATTVTRRIAKARVHVERLIRKLKCFGILK